MLRITENIDFDELKLKVEEIVQKWKQSVARSSQRIQNEFHSKLMISIIYHDSALEGTVLDHSEIQAATDTSIISDPSLIPSYESISNFNAATLVSLELAKQKTPITVELIKQLYGILNPAAKAEGLAYRTGNPLHRLYYHKISAPEDVQAKMKELDKWFKSDDFLKLEAIEKASQAHWRLMSIFPWLDYSGRLSRILSMMILKQEGHPLPVIHSIDRQDYYEALRSTEPQDIHKLYLDAIRTTATSAIEVYKAAS